MSILVPIRGRLINVSQKVSNKGNSYIVIFVEKPARVDDLGYAVGLPTVYKISVTNGKITLDELRRMLNSNVEVNAWINSNKFFSEREGCDDFLTSLSLARISLYNNVHTPRPSNINNIPENYPNLPRSVTDPGNVNNSSFDGNDNEDDLPF